MCTNEIHIHILATIVCVTGGMPFGWDKKEQCDNLPTNQKDQWESAPS